MLAKSGDKSQANQLFKRLLLLQVKAIRIINFQPQTSPFNNLFRENRILKISNYVNYKHALFFRSSLRKKTYRFSITCLRH